MPEDISVQILTQTSENIQKLFELGTRIDERVKSIQTRQEQIDKRIDGMIEQQNLIMQKVAVLEAKGDDVDHAEQTIRGVQSNLVDMDKRVSAVEDKHIAHADRWNKIASFIIQLVWVVLAAYLLTKLHLQAPSVP